MKNKEYALFQAAMLRSILVSLPVVFCPIINALFFLNTVDVLACLFFALCVFALYVILFFFEYFCICRFIADGKSQSFFLYVILIQYLLNLWIIPAAFFIYICEYIWILLLPTLPLFCFFYTRLILDFKYLKKMESKGFLMKSKKFCISMIFLGVIFSASIVPYISSTK